MNTALTSYEHLASELQKEVERLHEEVKMLTGLLRETPKRPMCDDLRHRVCAVLREGKDKRGTPWTTN